MAIASQALPYIRRAFEDEFVQEQLREAVSDARAAYFQARKQRTQAVDDKRLYRNLRQAATALQKATKALRPAEPEPKRRGRKLATLALAIGATALVTVRLQKRYAQRSGAAGTAPSAPESSAAATAARAQPEPASA